jgi:hypothetical protein
MSIFNTDSKNKAYITIEDHTLEIVDDYVNASLVSRVGNKHRAIKGLPILRLDTIKIRSDIADFSSAVSRTFEKPPFITTGQGKGRVVWALYPIALKVFFLYSPEHEACFLKEVISRKDMIQSNKPESFHKFQTMEEALNFRFDRKIIGELYSEIGLEIMQKMKNGRTFLEAERQINEEILKGVNSLMVKDKESFLFSLRSVE